MVGQHLDLNDHQKEYRKQILRLSPTPNFGPWSHSRSVVVEGAIGVGWTKDCRLLVLDYDSYRLVDVRDGTQQESRMNSITDHVSEDNLFFRGIDGELVNMYGLYGGNGNCITSDGWSLNVVCPAWPNSVVMLRNLRLKPSAKIWEGGALLRHKVIGYNDLRCGFSPDEKALVICNGEGAEIFARE